MHNIIKRNKHFKSLDTYTHMPKRASDNRFTKLPYVHTIITKPKLNIRSYYVFFFFFFTFSLLIPLHVSVKLTKTST